MLEHDAAMEQSKDLSQPICGVTNFRDVGQTVNQYLNQRLVREGIIFRSARPDDASDEDQAVIKDELGIKTIIDLRTKTELVNQADKHKAKTGNDELPRIPGIDYQEIKITGPQFERHLLRQLTWWIYLKVIFLYILGYRVDATRLIVSQVMIPRGLVGLGIDTVDYSGAQVGEALKLYTSAQTTPALVHCTQGKDRTGLMCALLLMILDVPNAAIEHDYFLTDAALAPERKERLAEIHQLGLSDEWAVTAPDMIRGLQQHLNNKYGGLNNYLDSIGFDESQRQNVRDLLLY